MTTGPTPEADPGTGVPVCYRHPGRESHIRCQRCERPICPECMRDAAVGFQCPECVAAGAKQTRSGRTTYGGLRPGNAGLTSMVLIAVNAAVWVAILATGGSSSRLVDALGLRPRGLCLTDQGAFVVGQARCVSGGPVYITDVPGEHDMALIRQITGVTTFGKTVVFRPSAVGRALEAYTAYAGPETGVLLKVGARTTARRRGAPASWGCSTSRAAA